MSKQISRPTKREREREREREKEREKLPRDVDTYLGLNAQLTDPRDSDRYDWSLLFMTARGHRDISIPLTFHSHKLWERLEGETINEFEPLL